MIKCWSWLGGGNVYKYRLLEISYPGEFVPRRIRTQNDWVRILWLIITRVRIIQRIRTLYITFILIIYNICIKLYIFVLFRNTKKFDVFY